MGTGRFLLGYPHPGEVRTEFMESMLRLQRYDFYHSQIMEGGLSAGGCLLEDNREAIASGFLSYQSPDKLKPNPEWLVFVDTDIGFTPETIYGLLAIADPVERPIVSALYYTTIEKAFTACWLKRNPLDNDYLTLSGQMSGLNEIDGCGMGCCIIHRSVLEKIRAEYEGRDAFTWFGRDRIQKKGKWTRLGEDLTFCRRAQSVGARIWGAVDLRVEHHKVRAENAVTMEERMQAMEYRKLLEQRAALDEEEVRKAACEVLYDSEISRLARLQHVNGFDGSRDSIAEDG